MKRVCSILLALLLLLSLAAGCGPANGGNANAPSPGGSSTPTPDAGQTAAPASPAPVADDALVYAAQYSSFPLDLLSYMAGSIAGSELYYITYNRNVETSSLCRIPLSGEAEPVVETIATLPEASNIFGFAAVSETEGWYAAPNEDQSAIELRRISLATGEELARLPMGQEFNGSSSLLPLGEGKLGFASPGPAGSTLYALAEDGSVSELGPLPMAKQDMYGSRLLLAGSIGEEILAYDYQGLYSFTPGQTELTELLRWLDMDIEPSRMIPLGAIGEDIFLMSTRGNINTNLVLDLVTLRLTPASQLPQRTELTLGCMVRDPMLTQAIFDFNRMDSEYRVRIIDYSEGQPVETLTLQGLVEQMNREVVNGNMPDILVTDVGLPLASYNEKGLFEDLSPYLENSGIELVPALVKAGEMDGKLVSVAPYFVILTMMGSRAVLGDAPNWTLDEALAVADTLPEGASLFQEGFTREVFLEFLYTYYLEEFVDWETGSVHFDSPVFAQLMELATQLPETADPTAYTSNDWIQDVLAGKVLLVSGNIGTMNGYLTTNAMYNGQLVCKGFPTVSGSGSAFNLVSPMAICAQSKHKEGAWRFISSVLSEDYQRLNTVYFPSNQAVFDTYMQDAMTEPKPEDGVMYTYMLSNGGYNDPYPHPWEGGEDERMPKGVIAFMTDMGEITQELPFYALTDEEAAAFYSFFNAIDRVVTYDQTLALIVSEETGGFFTGQRSLEETVRILQSRAGIYVSEQG